MNETGVDPLADAVEADLRRGLAKAGAVRNSVAPVLRHLLGHDDRALFSNEAIARLRGMLRDLARQLCQDMAMAAGDDRPAHSADPAVARIGEALAAVPGLLGHIHGGVLEWQAAQRLQRRLGVDPVVSPLLQSLVASRDADTAATAMKLLAAQARFARQQQQMQLPLGELPGDLLHLALLVLRDCAGREGAPGADVAAQAEAAIRGRYDESATRLGLIARLVAGMGGDAVAALALAHAGPAIFATALAQISGDDREACLSALTEGQGARLALTLRASGIPLAMVQQTVLALHPSGHLSGEPAPEELVAAVARVTPERAAQLLAVYAGEPRWIPPR